MHRITTAPVAPIPARTRWAVAAGVGATLTAAWWLGDTAPYPYPQRGLLDVPLRFLTADRMDAALRPRPGERIGDVDLPPGTSAGWEFSCPTEAISQLLRRTAHSAGH